MNHRPQMLPSSWDRGPGAVAFPGAIEARRMFGWRPAHCLDPQACVAPGGWPKATRCG